MTTGERIIWCRNCGGLFPDGLHNACAGRMGHAQFTPYPEDQQRAGAVVLPTLTEERVRQIVREELLRAFPPAGTVGVMGTLAEKQR